MEFLGFGRDDGEFAIIDRKNDERIRNVHKTTKQRLPGILPGEGLRRMHFRKRSAMREKPSGVFGPQDPSRNEMVPQEPTHKLCHGNEEHRRLYEGGVHVSYLKRNTIVPIARNQKGFRRFAALLLMGAPFWFWITDTPR